jgi:putative (di)nucleoside polyphosphate hydrolase
MVRVVIDNNGFRLNVGVMLLGPHQQLLWAKRWGDNSWQFPQGGMSENETPEDCLYRELQEEIGLNSDDVSILGCTQEWLSYRLPQHLVRHYRKPLCIGQKQKWFLLKLIHSEQKIRLNLSDHPEFDSWRWVDYWLPLKEVIFFKRNVYRDALREFSPLVFPNKK